MGGNGAEGWLANTCAAIQALGARVKLSDPVCLVLPAQHALIKFIDLPPVGPAQRAQILAVAGIPAGTLYQNPTIVTPQGLVERVR